jgi:sugar fermentation stimulation protein A
LRIGSLGSIGFKRGFYTYVGSARRSMKSRLARHLARKKTKRWHIDWLTTRSGVVPIAVASTTLTGIECRIATVLSKRADMRVDGFGCSDCECESHLYYFSKSDCLFLALENLKRYGVSVQESELGIQDWFCGSSENHAL